MTCETFRDCGRGDDAHESYFVVLPVMLDGRSRPVAELATAVGRDSLLVGLPTYLKWDQVTLRSSVFERN